ncbi:MAG TPA: glycosyltransferase 87 family protein [Terriglobales bacterium]|nr:glycosyltransferase 87 family protein [Terriglobales bacterium]
MRSQAPDAQFRWLAAAVLLNAAMLFGRFGMGTYGTAALTLVGISLLACLWALSVPLSSAGLPPHKPGRQVQLGLAAIILLHIGLGVATLRWVPPRRVDVYLFQQDAAAALLHGTNPYSITHQNLYARQSSFFYGPGVVKDGRVDFGFQYPPLSLLAILPGYLLGDLRYTYIAALLLAAALLVRIRFNRMTLIAVALLLLSPVTFYVLSRGWTEPLVLLLLCWTCLAALRRSRCLAVALGLFFASKQYAVLAVPLAALLLPRFTWKAYLRLLAAGLLCAAAVTAPFALWNFHDFWRDLVTWQLIQPFRPDALSFSVLAARMGLPQISQFVVIIATAAAAFWALTRKARMAPAFAGSLALVMLVFFCLNKQAFVNYYFLVSGAMLLVAVMSGDAVDPSPGEQQLASADCPASDP